MLLLRAFLYHINFNKYKYLQMKNISNKTIIAAFALSALVSCKPDLKSPGSDKGTADVTKYVAIGNSLTSGFADGALYYDGQKVSYANLLAEQFATVGGGAFTTPFMPAGVGVGSTGNAKFILGYSTDCKGVTGLAPVPAAASGDLAGLFTSVASQGPFNNMGVPGAKAITTVFPGYGNPGNGPGNYNPFFARMLAPSEYASASILAKAAAQNPTFFSLFIGNNDVLAYALAGGASDAITPSAGPPGVGFDASIDLIISTMTANGAKGVIANIGDVTSIPYFTTIPYNGLTLDATQAAQLNAAYAPLASFGVSFKEGSNPFMILDAAAPGGMRQMKAGELVILSTPQDSLKCAMWGSAKPLANKYVLTANEISSLQSAVVAYNNKLKSVADAKGFAFVDVNAFLANGKSGIIYNGITSTASFVSGGIFSLDGIHLTPRANALLANQFIKAINANYGATIKEKDATKYNGVIFP
jgi:hypothetical protein